MSFGCHISADMHEEEDSIILYEGNARVEMTDKDIIELIKNDIMSVGVMTNTIKSTLNEYDSINKNFTEIDNKLYNMTTNRSFYGENVIKVLGELNDERLVTNINGRGFKEAKVLKQTTK